MSLAKFLQRLALKGEKGAYDLRDKARVLSGLAGRGEKLSGEGSAADRLFTSKLDDLDPALRGEREEEYIKKMIEDSLWGRP